MKLGEITGVHAADAPIRVPEAKAATAARIHSFEPA